MRTRSKRSRRSIHQPEINLNSFTDLILNILLFFVFATELAVFEAIEVAIPVTEYSDKITNQRQEATIIFITKNNQILVDGENVTTNQLSSVLTKKSKMVSFSGIIVRGDLNSDLQTTVDVLSACKLAGIDKIKIETEKTSNS